MPETASAACQGCRSQCRRPLRARRAPGLHGGGHAWAVAAGRGISARDPPCMRKKRSAKPARSGLWVTSSTVLPARRVSLLEQGHHLGSGLGVQVAGGLVGEDQGGIMGQGARHRHPLLLAARQHVREAAGAIRQPHFGEQVQGPAAARLRHAALELQGQQQVLLHRQGGDEVVALEHEADMPAPEAGAIPFSTGIPGTAPRRGSRLHRADRGRPGG